jgi:Polyketide cyclase / dehydrase and lipid transport
MATLTKEIITPVTPQDVWNAIRDVGALHTRWVPGFVIATTLIPGGRRVTFGNGMVVDEPIISNDDSTRRLAWTAQGSSLGVTHYNAAIQVLGNGSGSRILWTVDLLPDSTSAAIEGMMDMAVLSMRRVLEALAGKALPAAGNVSHPP